MHEDEAELSRTPATSPDAAPEVSLDPDPVHGAEPQSSRAFAVLDAINSRSATTATRSPDEPRALSPAVEVDSVTQSPALPPHRDDPFVCRTATLRVTVPPVADSPVPEHAPPSAQSALAPAELDAETSPSVTSTVEPLSDPQSPPEIVQDACPWVSDRPSRDS